MAKSKWNIINIPDQKGRVVIITGASSGLGKEAAKVLASKNATVIMAVRNVEKGLKAANEIKSLDKNADIRVKEMDLSSLSSVKVFSEWFNSTFDRLDILINNAGVMACPYSKTEDGFEIQMGTNHLGHFALTGQLIDLLKKTDGSRLVVTSSVAHKFGKIDFSDLNWQNRKYKTNRAYGDSKMANLYFAYELARKLEAGKNGPVVTVAHPGWTETELQRHAGSMRLLNKIFAQSTDMGTLPTLRAAIDPDVMSGDYYGPSGFQEMNGYPVKVKSNKRSHDTEGARKLWEISEKLTGVKF